MAEKPSTVDDPRGGVLWRDLMGDGQTVFLFCVVYSGVLSLVVFANMMARERRRTPLPPQERAPRTADRDLSAAVIPLRKQA
jgi:hypothetical protein